MTEQRLTIFLLHLGRPSKGIYFMDSIDCMLGELCAMAEGSYYNIFGPRACL